MDSDVTLYDELLEEGELRGQIKTSHRFLLRQGKRFLGTPSEEIESELLTIQDLDRLERLLDATLTVKTWEELLATP